MSILCETCVLHQPVPTHPPCACPSFPEAPEVRAAYAAFLAARGDQIAAQRKYLEMPDRQREKYGQGNFLRSYPIQWPPTAIELVSKVSVAVGDKK